MQLYVYESGPESAQTVLFLHSSPLSGAMWRPQLERLGEFHCLAPDLPEHGRSAHIAPFEIGDTVARLVALIHASSTSGRAHVVGLSFGGVVAQALVVRAPEVVDHVVLSGTSSHLGPGMQALFRAYVALNRPLLALLRPERLARLVSLQFGIPRAYEAMLAEDVKRVSADSLARLLLASYAGIESPAEAASPTLIAVGQHETPFTKVMARHLVHDIAGARGVVVPGAGHVWNLQAPDLFAGTVRAWVMDRALPAELRPL